MTGVFRTTARRLRARPAAEAGWVALALALCAPGLRAQDVAITAVTAARECRVLLPAGDRIYGGLTDGGVIVWDAADPAVYERWTVSDGLSGQRVTAIAAGVEHLWVATAGAGLTRITPDVAGPTFRQYANIGGLDVTSVVATTRGETELVYYGLVDAGVGLIRSGLPQAIYTQAEHGLVSDAVTALALLGDDLWVGTEAGVSRFADNVFTTVTDGLPDPAVQTLVASGDTLLLAGTGDGVARWDAGAGQWSRLGALGGLIQSLAVRPDGVWALRQGIGIADRLFRWSGAAWEPLALPAPRMQVIAAGDGALWSAGSLVGSGMDPAGRASHALLARHDGTWATWLVAELAFLGVDGVGFGPDGAAWLGSREGVGIARRGPGAAHAQVLTLATADNDSSGLLHFGAGILTLTVAGDGDVWLAQFEKGLVRVRPGAAPDLSDAGYLHLTATNSPLSNNRIVRIVRHPDGPLLFCSDTGGVDLLADPTRPRDPASWRRLPTDAGGLAGATVREACFTARDIAWFAVERIGLVRWDLNGGAGPDDPLTWTDAGDDVWYSPLSTLPGLPAGALAFIRGLAASPDGSLWAGGAGGVHLLSPAGSGLSLVATWAGKTSVFVDGLLSSSVLDVELDANGDLWVALDAGLNRIRRRAEGTTIDAYTDIGSYDAYGLGALYGPGVLAPLPGGSVRELAADPGSRRLVAGTDYGAALLAVDALGGGGEAALAGLFLYPNPFAGGGGLKLGGVTADVTQAGGLLQGGATVEVYNLEGQVVYRASHVADNQAFWDGQNLRGEPVAGGLYVVKVNLDGNTAVRTLAVVR